MPILSAFGQDYRIVFPDSINDRVKIEHFTNVNSYSLDGYNYYIGWYDDLIKKYPQLNFYVYNTSRERIFEVKNFGDSNTHDLTFFKSRENPGQTIILGHNSNEYSWGNEVYLLSDGALSVIGNLNVGTFDPLDWYGDISKYTQIWTRPDGLKFTFSYDSLVYDPGGLNQQILTKEQIEYEYQNGQLQEKIKN